MIRRTIGINAFPRLFTCVTLLSCSTGFIWGQNLVPNPRFEQVDCLLGSPPRAPLSAAAPWFSPNRARNDDNHLLFAKVCSPGVLWDTRMVYGFMDLRSQYTTSGGVITNRGTYASAPLVQPLQAGAYYWFSMQAIIALGGTLGQQSQEERSFGVWFTPDRPAFPDEKMLPLTNGQPQVVFPNRRTEDRLTINGYTDNFAGKQTMQGCFQAAGNEQYLTIGDFVHPNYSRREAFLRFNDMSLTRMPDRISLGPDTSFCAGQRAQLNARFPFPATYRWQDGSTDSTLTVTRSGLYSLTITCPCRTYTDTVRVTVREPLLELGADTSVCAGQPITLSAGPGYDRYRWQDGSTRSTLLVSQPGVYSVEVERFNCPARDSIHVLPSGDCCELYLPTAFSPNADGVNDAFAVITGCSDVITEPEMLIYNRWGEPIFRTTDLTNGWNGYTQGVLSSVGEYTWQLRYALPKRRSLIKKQQQGTVLLTR
jgi:gliding motility-associated-like protein